MPQPRSLESMVDAGHREGYFESAYAMLKKEMEGLHRRYTNTRDALDDAQERIRELESDVAAWRGLAYRYGIQTVAEKRLRTQDLHGSLTLARELVTWNDDAIAYACADLAKKLRALASPEGAPHE